MNRRAKTLFSLSALAAAAVCLGACGKLGDLDRPAPFGSTTSREQQQYNAEKAAANRANGESNVNQSATSQTNGDYTYNDGAKDPALQVMRTSPPAGAPPSPFDSKSGGGGVLPDPYADPNTVPR